MTLPADMIESETVETLDPGTGGGVVDPNATPDSTGHAPIEHEVFDRPPAADAPPAQEAPADGDGMVDFAYGGQVYKVTPVQRDMLMQRGARALEEAERAQAEQEEAGPQSHKVGGAPAEEAPKVDPNGGWVNLGPGPDGQPMWTKDPAAIKIYNDNKELRERLDSWENQQKAKEDMAALNRGYEAATAQSPDFKDLSGYSTGPKLMQVLSMVNASAVKGSPAQHLAAATTLLKQFKDEILRGQASATAATVAKVPTAPGGAGVSGSKTPEITARQMNDDSLISQVARDLDALEASRT